MSDPSPPDNDGDKPAARRPVIKVPAVKVPSKQTQARMGHGTSAAQVALAVARGDYGAALSTAATQVALNENTYKAAAGLTQKVAPVAKALGFVGKKIPVVGAFVTAGIALYTVGAEASQGNYGKAATELGAGTAETLGNILGFGVGDAAREVVREGVVRTAGDKYAPGKSGIRELAEGAYDVGSKFVAEQTQPPASATTAGKPRPKGPAR